MKKFLFLSFLLIGCTTNTPVLKPTPEHVVVHTVIVYRYIPETISPDQLTIRPDPVVPFTGTLKQWVDYGAAQKAVADECRARLNTLSN